jgi:hypothetical protein
MPFKKGQPRSETAGRKAGTPNRDVSAIRDRFQQLIDSYSIDEMVADLKMIEKPETRLNILTGLAEYVIPKLARTELDAGENSKVKFSISINRAGS